MKSIKGRFGDGAGDLTGTYSFNKLKNSSQVNALLKSKKVSAVTKFLKIDKGFTGNSAEVNVSLNWVGGILCFSVKQTQGSMDFELREGSIEDVEPGIARLIGLLSVDSLVRRLKLDLKDVTNKGMVYDSIEGKAGLKNGIVKLKEMELKAPSAEGTIKGDVNIVDKTFDLKAKITPKVGATLPTIAALAGSANPLAALAIYTVMKVIPGVNENLVSYDYVVTGSWDNPKIKEKGSKGETRVEDKTDDLLNRQ